MKSAVSTLNPYAASYIPLAKRVVDDKIGVLKETAKDSTINETAYFGHCEINTQNIYCDKASLDSNALDTERLPISKVNPVKSQPIRDSYGSSSQHSNGKTDKQMLDDEFDMDLEYLQMQFPGVSVQSITDVYMANKNDLEATIDMLDQLESYTFDSAESLPESLDIGDISLFGPATESATLKLKEVVGEVSSSSGSLDAAALET